jgi:hypothetical protein
VPLAQVWTHCPFPSKIIFCTLIGFPMTNYSKFNISHILGLKISKSLSLNPTHWGLSTISRVHPNFPIIILLFKWIWSLNFVHYLMSSPLYVDTLWNQLSAPLLIKGRQYQKHNKGRHGLGNLNMIDKTKQNKKNYISYIYRLKLWQICWTKLHTLLHALSHLLGNKITWV